MIVQLKNRYEERIYIREDGSTEIRPGDLPFRDVDRIQFEIDITRTQGLNAYVPDVQLYLIEELEKKGWNLVGDRPKPLESKPGVVY